MMTVLTRRIRGAAVLGTACLSFGIAGSVLADPAPTAEQLSAAQAARAAQIVARGKEAAQLAQSAAGGRTTAGPVLTVEEVDGTKKNGPVGAAYDFGTLTALDTGKVEHTFILRNDNAGPVVIDRIPPTCGCTTVVVEGAKKDPFPISVDPGKDIHIHTAIDRGHLDGGSFTKNVLIYMGGQSAPSHTLALTGTMRPAVAIEPAVLDFGRVRNSESHMTTATISYDPRLFAEGAKPKVTTSVEGLKVREVNGGSVKPMAMSPIGPMDLPGYVVRSYEIETPKRMRLGTFWGQLTVTTKPALTQPNIGGIHGEVTGDITAEPASMAFGSVDPNAVTPQTLTIAGTTPQAVHGLRVDSANPLLRVTLSPIDPKTPASRTILVNLSPKTPPGAFQSYLTVQSKNGDEIGVIVNAYVLSKAELARMTK